MTTGKERQKWEMKTALHTVYFFLVFPSPPAFFPSWEGFKGGHLNKSPFRCEKQSKGGLRGILTDKAPLEIPPTPPLSKGGNLPVRP